MADLFSNPLVVAESAIGTILDRRSVILYDQPNSDWVKSYTGSNPIGTFIGEILEKLTLTELFTGIEIPYLSQISGFSVWGITYESANVTIDSEMCEHPIESGQKITDTSILNPVSAEIVIRMPTALYTQIYEEIVDYYENKKPIMMVTKFGTYDKMVISAMPYSLTHDEIDRPAIKLKLQQIIEVESSFVQTERGTVPAIKADRARNYDDTSRVDAGRVYTDTVASTTRGTV